MIGLRETGRLLPVPCRLQKLLFHLEHQFLVESADVEEEEIEEVEEGSRVVPLKTELLGESIEERLRQDVLVEEMGLG